MKVLSHATCWLCGQGHITLVLKGKETIVEPCSECGAGRK